MASSAESDRFDAIVLGAGPAGEVVATRLGECSMRTALVEAELIGGECAYWACIPSKNLLRPGEVSGEAERAPGGSRPELRWGEIAEYRDFTIRGLDDSKEIKSYEQLGAPSKGTGKLAGPGQVDIDGRILRSERIVIATGSEPQIRVIAGLEQAASGPTARRPRSPRCLTAR
jgi:pyruvate/2-oxoglutarate dehydrogenase complex dihydrolipoamide dehydrogenase (E3) component